jgi:hypothetical protein
MIAELGVQRVTRKLALQTVMAGFAAALLLSALAPALASQSAGNYHWARKQVPFTLQFAANVDGVWTDIFNRSISDWNKNDTIRLQVVAPEGSPQECRSSTGRVQVCNWRYGTQEGWLGLTRLFFDDRGDHIQSVTVQMNDSFFEQTSGQYNSGAARQHTMCHEMGHSLGLDHVDTDSCMNDSQYAVFNYVTPSKKDFAALARTYDHKDSSTTVAGKQKKVKKAKKDKKNKKGNGKKGKKNHKRKQDRQRARKEARERRATAEGFFSPTSLPSVPSGLVGAETVFTQQLDDGRRMVTFISWAQQGG